MSDTTTIDGGPIFRVARQQLDWSFPWHLERDVKIDGVWRIRLVSRHRSKAAADKALRKAERQVRKRADG